MPEDPKNQLESHADLEFVNNLKTAADVLLRLRMSVYTSDDRRRRDLRLYESSDSDDSYESSESGDTDNPSSQLSVMPLPPQSPPCSSDNNYTNTQTPQATPTTPLPQPSNRATPEEVQEHIVHNYAYAYTDASFALAQSLGISIEDAQMILNDNN